MFYYINVANMPRIRSQEVIASVVNRTHINDDNIIQQYFPITTGETRVEVISVPNIITNEKIANSINNKLQLIVEEFKNLKPIQNIDEIYE
jgi:delta-aminolevulinic acid dehydratase/porphobilinogen synthase